MTIQFEFPGFKNPPAINHWIKAEQTLRAACDNLSDLLASWEYPGFIQIYAYGKLFAFGMVNGCFGYDTQGFDPLNERIPLPLTSTLDELTAWIRKVVAK